MRIKTSWVALSVVVLSVGLLLVASLGTPSSARGSNQSFRNGHPRRERAYPLSPQLRHRRQRLHTTGADGCCAIS